MSLEKGAWGEGWWGWGGGGDKNKPGEAGVVVVVSFVIARPRFA